jgi:hypothetical protein
MTTQGVELVLVREDGSEIALTQDQRDHVFACRPELEREARRWRAKTGGEGRLLVIDPGIVDAALELIRLSV